ncbi:MAG TPA: formyl transferase [Caulobacteraceae bacterium]|nr:formyl transferase [Caulobacteraceae bacterium]
MKVVLLTSDAPGQRALAARLASIPNVELAGVVVQAIAPTHGWRLLRTNPARFADKAAGRLLHGAATAKIAREAVRRFDPVQPWPARATPVTDINSAATVDVLRALAPDLICVSGTRMIKAPVFDTRPPRGLLNLHTGISPFYRGGPNCTLWCLSNAEPQFVGATIHELDPGIDSGRLILTEQTPIDANDRAADLVWKTVEHGIAMYARVVGALAAGQAVQTAGQDDLGKGRTYFTREWGAGELGRALQFVRSGGVKRWVEAGRPGAVKLYDGLTR